MRDDAGIVQIWTVSPNGGDPQQLTHNPFDVASTFSWSPDGNSIAYVADNSVFTTDAKSGDVNAAHAANCRGSATEASVFCRRRLRLCCSASERYVQPVFVATCGSRCCSTTALTAKLQPRYFRWRLRSAINLCSAINVESNLSRANNLPSSSSLTRTAWLVVVLLMPVALLNYLDRQMLASMKYSVMADIPSIGTEAELGVHARAVQMGVCGLQPHRRLRCRSLQPALRDLCQPVRVVRRDVGDGPRHDLSTSCSGRVRSWASARRFIFRRRWR